VPVDKKEESVDRIMERIAMDREPPRAPEGSPDVKVGEKIRVMRERLGMTVQDLADKSGFSAALITQIENRMVSPPLGVLVEIANGMNLPISSFLFEGEGKHFTIVRKENRRTVSRVAVRGASVEDYSYESLGAAKKDHKMEPFVVRLRPRGRRALSMSVHSGEEFIYVLSGSVEVVLEGYGEVLGEGDSIYFDSPIPHHVHATEGEATILAVLYQEREEA